MKHEARNHATHIRLIVRVMQDVARIGDHFDCYADFIDVVKYRCARLHLRYDATTITDAIDRFECGGQQPLICQRPRRLLVPDPGTFSKPSAPNGADSGHFISRADAPGIVRRLWDEWESRCACGNAQQ